MITCIGCRRDRTDDPEVDGDGIGTCPTCGSRDVQVEVGSPLSWQPPLKVGKVLVAVGTEWCERCEVDHRVWDVIQ